ncbi:MAG: hypothetical protein K2M27_07855 [Muribaculaceae bacterium]|nr:hypothetical protein [Muribaculaceae bacterium]
MGKSVHFMVLLVLFVCSCTSGRDGMIESDGIMFVRDWEFDNPLVADVGFECDEIGVRGIRVLDSVMILSNDKNWGIFTIDCKRKLGEMFSIGQGPGEFVMFIPQSNYCGYVTENDSLVVYAPDLMKSKIVRANIDNLVAGITPVAEEVMDIPPFSAPTLDVVPIDSVSYFLLAFNDERTAVSRLVSIGDSIYVIPGTERFNGMCVKDAQKSNLLGHQTLFNAKHRKIVEGFYSLNRIHLYGLDSGDALTICVGDKLDSVEEIEQLEERMFPKRYSVLAQCDNCFGAICPVVGDKDNGNYGKSDLQVFDWDGRPIYRTVFPFQIDVFGFDLRNGRLIVHDEYEDMVLAYDATPIIERLE